MKNLMALDKFYPQEFLEIIEVVENEKIIIQLKSITKSCVCPKCDEKSTHYHGTYIRKVQDLPILGKNVRLEMIAREYPCDNEWGSLITMSES